ncbi:MAG: hypothetical protein ABI823_00245 [Bryobacteraceae bacterium]
MKYWLILLVAASLPAEILDRIAVTIGRQVITGSQVLDELRVAAFIEGEKPDLSGASKRKAAERLVERALIDRELILNRYSLPQDTEIGALLAQVKVRYPSEEAYKAALTAAGVTAFEIDNHLKLRVRLVQFIDYRFQPGVQVSEDDIKDLYDKQVADWKTKRSEPPPSLEDSRAEIVAVLSRERADRALDRWLGETRTREDIVYREEVFR